ncbi:MAG: Nif3-like dinuclear metal center hexameric protein [Alkalibacterium sp.]|nr:Nif3-like dinuclear metal center hexameric protein [Alkalibacterium sp.]
MREVTVKDIIQFMDRIAPPELAEDWDPIGLSFGSVDQPVSKILLALDVDAQTIQEAKEKEVDLLITHHPAIFKSLKTLNSDDPRRRDYIELLKSDIAVYSAHTNLDAAENGLNDWLADHIGLKADKRDIVSVNARQGYKKLAVYVPDYAADKVRQALHEAGAGEIGDYKDVSYTLEGYGRFTPQAGANPTEGEIGQEEVIHEQRIEVLLKNKDVYKAIDALKTAHPYEEPVFDLYNLENQSDQFGFGRIGYVESELTTADMAERIQTLFSVDGVRYGSADDTKTHKKIAVFGGSGEKYYKDALKKDATLYITGDISYHGAQDMLRDGIDFIDAGHYMEAICVPELASRLKDQSKANGWNLEIIETNAQKDVFTYYK